MILFDPRDGGIKKRDGELSTSEIMVSHCRKVGVLAERSLLPSADAAFEGNGPRGSIMVGVERKTIPDLLKCIQDGRYNEQRVKMLTQYQRSILLVEGMWRPHDENFFLMESRNGSDYYYSNFRSKKAMYSTVYRYLISVSLSGVIVTYSRNLWETAFNICEWFHYFQKRWEDHTAMLDIHRVNLPSLNYNPNILKFEAPLVRKWATDINGVGIKYSMEAERLFKFPYKLAMADEADWMQIQGIGAATAKRIVRDIWGD